MGLGNAHVILVDLSHFGTAQKPEILFGPIYVSAASVLWHTEPR